MSSTPIKTLICSVVSLAIMPVLAADMEFTGTAKTETGAILYQEKHRVSGTCQEGVFRPKDHQIGYHRPEAAETFASKDLTYPDAVIRPTVEFLQPDFGESLSIQYTSPDTLAIEWQKPNKELKRYDVTYNQDVVVDAGFDTLVRQQLLGLGEPEEQVHGFLLFFGVSAKGPCFFQSLHHGHPLLFLGEGWIVGAFGNEVSSFVRKSDRTLLSASYTYELRRSLAPQTKPAYVSDLVTKCSYVRRGRGSFGFR